jgi:hypothetical protein
MAQNDTPTPAAHALAPHEIREQLNGMKEKLDFLRGSL